MPAPVAEPSSYIAPAPVGTVPTPVPAPQPAPLPAPTAPPAPTLPEAPPLPSDPVSQPQPAPTEQPAPARRTYTNPVFDKNAPDPSIVRADDGSFYAYTTETDGLPFQVLRSADLTTWERVGAAFENGGPDWITEHRWAPDVVKTGDHYTMLFSGRGADGKQRIGYATSPSPSGPFQDRGVLVEANSVGYVIDPNLEQVGDRWVMYYGSTGGRDQPGQDGITAVDLDIAADGTITPKGPGSVVLPEGADRHLVEGAWMHQRDGKFYLFYSDGRWDAKGGDQDYAVKVARADSPTGPFEKLGDPILAKGNGVTGPGHMSIVTDDAGQDWMLYHGWGADTDRGRLLRMDPVEWRNGWPVVNGGNGPSTSPMDAPVIAAREGVAALAQ